jgi:tRNA threonylcarbamoyladenosine biosynthesis protein TsaB
MTRKGSGPVILAIDSAGLACSAVVAVGDTILSAERVETRHSQAEALMPMVDAAMRKAGLPPAALDLVAATVGPGSFTGIRVGLAAARGIALATGAQLIGVSSFEAVAASLAQGLAQPDCGDVQFLLIALESRREDLYVQLFALPWTPVGPPASMMPAALREAVNAAVGEAPLLIAGDAAQRVALVLSNCADTVIVEDSAPDAAGVLRAGLRRWRSGAVDAPRPLYLRPPDVTLPSSRRASSLSRA